MIGVGAVILALSTLMPWYADLDSYRIGDQFLGITGPGSFVGLAILVLSVFSLWLFSYHLLERHAPVLPVREAILHLFVSIESLFLLVIVNSIFFHPKFGVNITLKESRFGMTIAFVGAIVMLVGAYMKNKEEVSANESVGKLEPLIKMGESTAKTETAAQDRSHAPVAPARKFYQPQPAHRPVVPGIKQESVFKEKPFMFGEGAAAGLAKPAMPSAAPSAPAAPKSEDDKGFMLRMDL
jgi:hypothetical protein